MRVSRSHTTAASHAAAGRLSTCTSSRSGRTNRPVFLAPAFLASALAVVFAVFTSLTVHGQSAAMKQPSFDLTAPDEITSDRVGNVFAVLPAKRFQGLAIEIAGGARLVDASVESYQEGPLASRFQIDKNGTSGKLVVDGPLETPAVVILSFRPADFSTEVVVKATPLEASFVAPVPDLGEQVVRRVVVRKPASRGNQVLDLSRDSPPLEIQERRLRSISVGAAFTLAGWIRTTDIGGIFLSSWTGREADEYPFELLVGVDGSAVFYRGKPGHHESMRSAVPVADGAWHHVAVTNNPARGRAVLYVDGLATDSLLTDFDAVGTGVRLLAGARPGPDNRMASASLFAGQLDDVGLWNQALGAVDVAKLAAGSSRVVAQPIVFQRFTQDDLASGRLPRYVRLASAETYDKSTQIQLQGRLVSGSVELSWNAGGSTPASQSAMFDVERSDDGISFERIGTVSGNTSDDAYEFRDSFIDSEVVFYRIATAGDDGVKRYSTVMKFGLADPLGVDSGLLNGNAPNPFSDATTINFELPDAGHVQLSVWDLSGQPIRVLVDADLAAGLHETQFVAGDLSAGTYFIRLQYEDRIESAKMLLVK